MTMEGARPADPLRGRSRAAMIAELAYRKWQSRGCPPGDDRRDWLEAEEEIGALYDSRGIGRCGVEDNVEPEVSVRVSDPVRGQR